MSTASRSASAAPPVRRTPKRTAARTRSAAPPVAWTCPTRWADRSTSRSTSTSPAPDPDAVRPGPPTGRTVFGPRTFHNERIVTVNNNKPFIVLAGVIGAVFVTSFVIRFFVLSEMGLPGSWMLMFLLPAGGIGLLVVLLRLGLLHSMTQSFSAFGSTTPPAPSKSQRLQEIENLRASGALSEDEYTAERARI